MREFWVASGHQLTRLDRSACMQVTDELILAWLARPEILPPQEACDAELALHTKLLAAPKAPVAAGEIDAIEDADAQENWRFLLRLRNILLAEGSVEAGYLRLVREAVALPILFYNQLVQLILRNALDGCEDTRVLRAAELFFRPQRAYVTDGALMLADDELVAEIEADKHANPLGAMMTGGVEALDVLGENNGWTYWSRSDAHSMVLPFGADPKARNALGHVIEVWIEHLLGRKVSVSALNEVPNTDLRWFVGLDPVGTEIGNALWNDTVPKNSLVGIYALTFASYDGIEPGIEGHPVYLLLGMGSDNVIRCKPQNLVTNLPIVEAGARQSVPAPVEGA